MNIAKKSLIVGLLFFGVGLQAAEIKKAAEQQVLAQESVSHEEAIHKFLLDFGIDIKPAEIKKNAEKKLVTERLPISCRNCNVDQVKWCLSREANPNYINPLLIEPPLTAALWGINNSIEDGEQEKAKQYLAIAELLLQAGANPNMKYTDEDREHATIRTFDECLQFIGKNGTVVPAAPMFGEEPDEPIVRDLTPMYQAIELLLVHGADDTLADDEGSTIHTCAEVDPKLQEILKRHAQKAKEKMADAILSLPTEIIHLCGDKLYVTDSDRVLYQAARDGEIKKVASELAKNADPNITIERNCVLQRTIDNWHNVKGHTVKPIVKLLLQARADPNYRVSLLNTYISPLESICSTMNFCKHPDDIQNFPQLLDCVDLLLHHRCDANAVTAAGLTHLVDAARCKLPGLVSLYLKHGADTLKKDGYGKTFEDDAQDKPEIHRAYKDHYKNLIADAIPELEKAQHELISNYLVGEKA